MTSWEFLLAFGLINTVVKYPSQVNVIFKNYKYPTFRPSVITKVFVNFRYDEDMKVWGCKRQIRLINVEPVIKYPMFCSRILHKTKI